MALGGGTFSVQNKVLPGTYINFVSASKASSNLSSRGWATMPFSLNWGKEGEIFEVTSEDFEKNSLKIFGYEYENENLKNLRELFLNVKTLYAYRLNSGVKATCSLATAVYSGVRGNDLKIVCSTNVDDEDVYDVSTILETIVVDKQSVKKSADLVDNDFVVFNKSATLSVTASTPLTGGTNGTVTTANHQSYLDKAEKYAFNVMGVATTDSTLKSLYVNYTKRMRDEIGAKFQLVLYDKADADYEGVISVKNKCIDNVAVVDDETTYPHEADLVYWVTGLEASCEINKSCLNRIYNGEYIVDCDYTQSQLTQAILNGEYTLHNVGSDIRVLSDINALITVSDTKGDVFKDNQTIRVVDQIANDIANIFNTKYLGTVPNDESGRISLWADIVKHHSQLQDIRAIENFSDDNVTVAQGENKKAVIVSDLITIVNAMTQLYMSVKVS